MSTDQQPLHQTTVSSPWKAKMEPTVQGALSLTAAAVAAGGKKPPARRNAWGNLSYADLITQAITSSPDQRMTLSQIYDWMVKNIDYFKDKGDSSSSAGWKNSIRHNLSLHQQFMRIPNEGPGKSSWWVINRDAKPGKSTRRRAMSVDAGGGAGARGDKRRGRHRRSTSKGVIDTIAAASGSPSPSPASLPVPPTHLAWSPSPVDERTLSVSPSIGSPTNFNDPLSADSYSSSFLSHSAGYEFTPPPLETVLRAPEIEPGFVDSQVGMYGAGAIAADFVTSFRDRIDEQGGDIYGSIPPPPPLTSYRQVYNYKPSLSPISGSKANTPMTTPLGTPPLHRRSAIRPVTDYAESTSSQLPPPSLTYHHQHVQAQPQPRARSQQHQHQYHHQQQPQQQPMYRQYGSLPSPSSSQGLSSSWSQPYPAHPHHQHQPQHQLHHDQGYYNQQPGYGQPPPYNYSSSSGGLRQQTHSHEFNQYERMHGPPADYHPLMANCAGLSRPTYHDMGYMPGAGHLHTSPDAFPSDLDMALLNLDDVLSPEIIFNETDQETGLNFDFDHFREKDLSNWVH
eukprot:m.14897 g.14897  ORF g.14897 m.14897 type:complete len:566 (+) comp26034_c0_seq1:188-1885(+)